MAKNEITLVGNEKLHRQHIQDLSEALELLNKAGPNPLLITEKEYWARYDRLMQKYFPEDSDANDS